MKKRRFMAMLVLATLVGCGGEMGSGGGGSEPGTSSSSNSSGAVGMGGGGGEGEVVEPAGTSVFLQVFDTMGNPIPTAAVTVNGLTRATNGAGQILYENLPAGRFVARVEAYRYAPASAVLELPSSAHGGMEVSLLPLGMPIPFSADQWATLDQGATRVTIPPFSIVDENGEPVTGMVEATIVPLDPTKDIALAPGPLEGIPSAGGQDAGLESVFMAEISLWQNGNRLQLKPGSQATLEMVLPDSLQGQYQSGDTVPAWYFDLDAGTWKEEGAGTIGPSLLQPGKLAWTAQVGHFSWWNCDAPWTDKNCFDVVLLDLNGNPLPNYTVSAQGTSYTGASSGSVTGQNGHACMEIKLNGTAEILVSGSDVSQQVTGSGTASGCKGMGAACKTVTLAVPPVPICSPGASKPCPYSGPTNTLGIGVCQAGADFCRADGMAWLGCAGEVKPMPENCNTPFDDDCDGLVNEEGQGCNCTPGTTAACYTGPMGTVGVGPCKFGNRTCNLNGKGYGPCMGQVLPKQDVCATPADDDCNGLADCFETPLWSKKSANIGYGFGSGVETDAASNVVVVGNFKGSVDFGVGPITAVGPADILVVKLDAAGNQLWAKSFDANNVNDKAVGVDASGNVFLGASSATTVDFGGGPLISAGNNDVVVVKFTPGGDHLWSKIFGDAAYQMLADIAVRSNGEVALAGDFSGAIDFGGGPLGAPLLDGFVAKLDAAGNHLWSKRLGSATKGSCSSVAIDGNGNTVTAGYFEGTMDIGAGLLTSAGLYDIYVAKLDPTGNVIWNKRFGSAMYDRVSSVAFDVAGNVILQGTFHDVVDFGGGPLGSAGVQSQFLLKFDSAGNHVWSKSLAGVGGFLVVHTSGDIMVSGSNSNGNEIITRFDTSGNWLWSRYINDSIGDIAFDSAGNALVTGHYMKNVMLEKYGP